MGIITKSFEAENNLTVFTVVGEISAEQILGQSIAFLADNPSQLVLWDFRLASLANISGAELRMMIEQGKPFADSRKGGLTAIVCAKEIDYGISRMFQTLAEILEIPFEIQVFRNIQDARISLATIKTA